MSPEEKTAINRWPPQIKYIVGNEACERFSFYGMKGILALYITNVLLQTKDQATNVIHLFGFANYFMPLLGAWVSDRLWGRYHTILWISLSYCVGHAVLATSDFIPSLDGKVLALYIGLGLIAFGSGGIKPCVSAFMGDQFKPEQRHLLQKAYAAFYWSINLGSFFSFIIIPAIRKSWGYSWAFGVPGIFMAIATLIFWLGTRKYVRIKPVGDRLWAWKIAGFLAWGTAIAFVEAVSKAAGFAVWQRVILGFVTTGMLIAVATYLFHRYLNSQSGRVTGGFFGVFWYALTRMLAKGAPRGFWAKSLQKFNDESVASAKTVLPILSIFALIPVFWALFDQTFSTWVLQGEKMLPYKLGGWTVGPEEMLSMNPLLVMVLVPIMTLGLYPLLGKLATPLRRMSLGMFLAAASYVVVAMLQSRLEAGAQLSVLWQTAPYILLTIAEVLVSTTGLEFAYREAAPEMKSTITALFYLTVAVGNLLVTGITSLARIVLGIGEGQDVSVTTTMFMFYAGLTFVVAIVFSIIAAFYRYRDAAAAQGR